MAIIGEQARVLVTVKTSPRPSATYGDTVCVAGIRLGGVSSTTGDEGGGIHAALVGDASELHRSAGLDRVHRQSCASGLLPVATC